jgi:hypothetical protein
VLECLTRDSGTEIGYKNQNKGTKRPTPSIIDENRRSRPSPGVSGDKESSVKEGEKKNVQGREGEGNLWSWCLKKRER